MFASKPTLPSSSSASQAINVRFVCTASTPSIACAASM
jgi:hypothetical protein